MINELEIWSVLLANPTFGNEIQNLLDIGELIWLRGWAEANAGNVSIRLPESITESLIQLLHCNVKNYVWFLVSSTGSRYREFNKLGLQNFNLIGLDKADFKSGISNKQIIFPEYRKPTSEWVTHLSVHEWLYQNRDNDTIVLHAHPTDWITISNCRKYKDSKPELIKEIRESLPELNIYFPQGITLLPFAVPGSDELAELTVKGLNQSKIVIWEKHGILITAKDVNCAFDYLEIVSKAASVYLAHGN